MEEDERLVRFEEELKESERLALIGMFKRTRDDLGDLFNKALEECDKAIALEEAENKAKNKKIKNNSGRE